MLGRFALLKRRYGTVKPAGRLFRAQNHDRSENKDLILSILKLTTTKRETNQYLSRYSTPLSRGSGAGSSSGASGDPQQNKWPFRVVLMKIKGNLSQYPVGELKKFHKTLRYMKKLGANPVLFIDPDFLQHEDLGNSFFQYDNLIFDQYQRLSNSLELDGLKLSPIRCLLTDMKLSSPELLVAPLQQDLTPVIYPYVYDSADSREVIVNSTDYLERFVQELYELNEADDTLDLTVEKVVYLDNLGGPPSVERSNNSHVFINLNQEYDRIISELNIGHLSIEDKTRHIDNLTSMKRVLSAYNSLDLTGMITTLGIANENLNLNPIVYNILTGRSLISSSLPVTKFNKKKVHEQIRKTSVIRKGLDIKIVRSVDELDLSKFKALIDDSFKRSLNLNHYLDRIAHSLSSIIIVGDYDGIAIITNETDPVSGLSYPYLDKFAISRKIQGSLSIADIIFNILKTNYKHQLIWRSKKVNPVNGWYFQRSHGSLSLDQSEFRLFWFGKLNQPQLEHCVRITKSIKPSWDDCT